MTTYRTDDGTEVEVEYSIEQRGSRGNGWNDPGEATIVNILEAFTLDGDPTALSDAERERIEQQIGEQLDSEPDDDLYDY